MLLLLEVLVLLLLCLPRLRKLVLLDYLHVLLLVMLLLLLRRCLLFHFFRRCGSAFDGRRASKERIQVE
jgi:hypothetical protein